MGVNIEKITDKTKFLKGTLSGPPKTSKPPTPEELGFSNTTYPQDKFNLIQKFIKEKNEIINNFKKIIKDLNYDNILYEVKYKNFQTLCDIFLDIVNVSANISSLNTSLQTGVASITGNGGRPLVNIISDINELNTKEMSNRKIYTNGGMTLKEKMDKIFENRNSMNKRYDDIKKTIDKIKVDINKFNEQLKLKRMSDEQLSDFVKQKTEINKTIEKIDKDVKSFLMDYQKSLEIIIWGEIKS